MPGSQHMISKIIVLSKHWRSRQDKSAKPYGIEVALRLSRFVDCAWPGPERFSEEPKGTPVSPRNRAPF